jgi:hypothetical protein
MTVSETETKVEATVSAPKRFFFETITGLCIFGIIAAAAVGLSYIVTALDNNGVDKVIVYGLRTAEYLIFGCDLILLARFLWCTSLKTWRHL